MNANNPSPHCILTFHASRFTPSVLRFLILCLAVLSASISQARDTDMDLLIKQLGHHEVATREAAIHAFVEMGPAALPLLASALQEDDETIRESAVLALSRLGKLAIPTLATTLKDPSLRVRHAAIDALGCMKVLAKSVVPTLIVFLLKDKDAEIRQAAAETLGKLGPEANDAIPALIQALRDDSEAVRVKTAEALGYMGALAESAVTRLQPYLNDESEQLRRTVVRALGRIGQPTEAIVPALIGKFTDVRESVRSEAAMVLKEIGTPAIPYLVDGLADERKAVRFYATMALGAIGPSAKKAIPVLTQALGDENPGVRNLGCIALGRIGEAAKEAIPYLTISVLTDAGMRQNAIEALGKIGPSAQGAGPTLAAILSDEKWEVRQSAVQALWRVRADHAVAVPALIKALNADDNEVVRADAAEVLGKITQPLEDVVPALIDALTDKNITVHDTAVTSLERIGAPAIPFLIQTLERGDVTLRGRVTYLLGQLGGGIGKPTDREIAAALYNASKDKASPYQAGVIGALRAMGTPAISFLMRSLYDSDSDVREHMAYLLGKVGKPADKIIPALIKGLNDEHPEVRIAAEKALRDMGTAKLILFSVDSAFYDDLNRGGVVSRRLRQQFEENGPPLSPDATLSMWKGGRRWSISSRDQVYIIWEEDEKLHVSAAANIALLEHRSAERKKRNAKRRRR